MKKLLLAAAGAALFAGCAESPDVIYRPYPQILPQHVKKLAVRPFVNKTEQFGLEDKLNLRVSDEFQKEGTCAVTPEADADAVIAGEIRRYILTPIQYDAAMVSSAYKLDVLLGVKLYDKQTNFYLWEEPALEAIQVYSASTLPGGMTEEQAREAIWEKMAKDIVKRTIEGFGSVSSTSSRRIAAEEPVQTSTAPAKP